MTLAELRERYKDQVPFVLAEITDGKLTTAHREAVNCYNKFKPMIVKFTDIMVGSTEYQFTGTIPNHVLRVHNFSWPTVGSTDSLVWEWDYAKPILHIIPGRYTITGTMNWNLVDMTLEQLDENDLLCNLLRVELKIAMSNRRRTGTLNELPIDFKGDQFYSEALDEKRELKEQIGMLPPITF
jgi:hypothetical protein